MESKEIQNVNLLNILNISKENAKKLVYGAEVENMFCIANLKNLDKDRTIVFLANCSDNENVTDYKFFTVVINEPKTDENLYEGLFGIFKDINIMNVEWVFLSPTITLNLETEEVHVKYSNPHKMLANPSAKAFAEVIIDLPNKDLILKDMANEEK